MKYFKAILFTLLMALIFFGVIIFVEGVFAARKMADVINTALEEDNYHVLLRANFQSKEPMINEVITTDEFTLNIRGFETAAVVNSELKHYFEFTIVTIDGEIGLTDMAATLKTDTEEIPIWFLKYFNLEVYTVVTDSSSYKVFEVSDIFKDGATVLESLILSYTPENATSETEIIIDVQKQEADFVFANIIIDYYNNHDNNYPTLETDEIKLHQHVEINT
ncbi:MAG: hypothetical protein RG740_04110, partial [Acholeplasmataceae bacterium]|nr:hypothetical protein [Acholeplasmataceae bacterium]